MSEQQDKSSKVNVRKGTPQDGELLVELVCALADYEHLPRPTQDARERLVRDGFGPAPRFDTWFGEYAGRAVGYAITFYTYSTFLALPTFYLEDLFVLPEYRALKVGKALFVNCAQVAWEQGCGRMEWQVLHWNTPALAFYEHLGGARQADWLPWRATRDELQKIIAR
jgi:GNAT superfamily N-acetyltransferase